MKLIENNANNNADIESERVQLESKCFEGGSMWPRTFLCERLIDLFG